jgi:peptidoglycan/LPS O-acetylase OafA/YrhL
MSPPQPGPAHAPSAAEATTTTKHSGPTRQSGPGPRPATKLSSHARQTGPPTPTPPDPDRPAPRADPDPRRAKLPSLTGLRFIAAALVFLFHSSLTHIPMSPFADPGVAEGYRWILSKAGWTGVSFFFVLSGFVLTWSARPTDTAAGFWRRRVLKIFPSHVTTWALAMGLFAGATTPWSAWLPNLFLIHSWFPHLDVYLGVNPPAWSLCSELLFYLLFPLLIRPVRRIRENTLRIWAAAMVAGMVMVELVADFLAPASAHMPGTGISVWQFWFGYNFPPVRMFEFVLGMLLARMMQAGRAPRIRLIPAGLLLAAGYALALTVPFLYGLGITTVIPIALLICAAAKADIHGTPTLLRGRTMQWLGEVSFGFYLAQYVVMYSVRTRILHEHRYAVIGGVVDLLGFFALTLLVGWALLVLVERPAIRRWTRPKNPARTIPENRKATDLPSGGNSHHHAHRPIAQSTEEKGRE